MTTQNLALIQKQQQQDKIQDQENQQQQKKIISFNEFIGTVLVFTKQVLIKYPKLTRMLDEENYGFGLDMYNDKQEDPQATNAINTTIHQELINISKNTDIVDMQLIAVKILKQEPLPNQISTLKNDT
ncbi:hypothetical protein PPERSA_10497 [Pseudocohnilembus persalinus]|uniref:Uncharacterized protein n=1 Tax=Pseudocohnilembus persalinus TaxID=266149 RepID=A0A0V0R7D4_PSEPJ|nr:hypothetical protein PPERSA_10497 [Pseudocohnilembus persalinus]|eukprot:KRX10398.1 hypothetical protein PPERSA_10497 [Pseudocohnilembus persalinus]